MLPLAVTTKTGIARVIAYAIDGRIYAYNPGQLRRPKGDVGGGRWTSGESQGRTVEVRPARAGDLAFSGEQKAIRNVLGKQEVGKISEAITVAWLKQNGFPGAHSLNFDRNNFPLDLVDDHKVFEVKGGLISNRSDAQKWRLTIGEPGAKEKAWLAKASPNQKAAFNERKMLKIFERKTAAMKEVQQRYGKRIIGGETLTVLLDPDRGLADVYRFKGFHKSITWNSDQAKAGYQGTLKWK